MLAVFAVFFTGLFFFCSPSLGAINGLNEDKLWEKIYKEQYPLWEEARENMFSHYQDMGRNKGAKEIWKKRFWNKSFEADIDYDGKKEKITAFFSLAPQPNRAPSEEIICRLHIESDNETILGANLGNEGAFIFYDLFPEYRGKEILLFYKSEDRFRDNWWVPYYMDVFAKRLDGAYRISAHIKDPSDRTQPLYSGIGKFGGWAVSDDLLELLEKELVDRGGQICEFCRSLPEEATLAYYQKEGGKRNLNFSGRAEGDNFLSFSATEISSEGKPTHIIHYLLEKIGDQWDVVTFCLAETDGEPPWITEGEAEYFSLSSVVLNQLGWKVVSDEEAIETIDD